jgi:hypothetical protein
MSKEFEEGDKPSSQSHLGQKKNISDFESKIVDRKLYNVICVLEAALVELKKIKNFSIEELRMNKNFLYTIDNHEKNVTGYVGKDKITGETIFIIMDKSRILWGMKEGFTREECFEKVGVLRRVDGINSFLKFLAGEKDCVFDGEYILNKT